MNPVVAPLRALRYDTRRVTLSKVLSPPYDVISDEGRERLYASDPHNFVRLDYGRLLPEDRPGSDRYDRAAAELSCWVKEGILKRDPDPAFYLYSQTFLWNGQTLERRGFFALRRLERFGEGRVYPHEKTLSGPKIDRFNLMKATQAQMSPVFGLYADADRRLAALLEQGFRSTPETDFVDGGGMRHRMWRVADPLVFRTADETFSKAGIFIADGHHRYETAVAYRDAIEKRGKISDESSLNYILLFFCESSDPGLLVLPTHRVVRSAGAHAASLRDKLARWFDEKTFDNEPAFLRALESDPIGPAQFGFLFPGETSFHLLTLRTGEKEVQKALEAVPPVSRAVDTAVLHQLILRNCLQFSEEDERDPARIRFVKETAEAIGARPSSEVVILCRSQPMEVFRRVAEAGLILPPKTTFFYPKLPSGLLIQPLNSGERV